MSPKTNYQTADDYIGTFPKAVQEGLEQIRQTVRDTEPDAEEIISYQIPAFEYHGKLIYYSAYTKHYSLSFPPPFTIFEAFKEQLSPYEVSKSVIQLPMDRPLPLELIRELVKFRAKENKENAAGKKKK
ncbi:iron chaperone [Cohnella herbarum]|uniref:DUF1801 domain-containing protein n=1 Tax=Cohnella herbarum TaxID=2728023 RepID=A0A7Z2VNQ5_9BACL|nr:DUF1801 domain-containing protein [Cohnella herbarum]QJD86383.1 DUF1801 domain-containing protein [Cohnella herbarum]